MLDSRGNNRVVESAGRSVSWQEQIAAEGHAEQTAQISRYLRLLAILVQREGGNVVIDDDELMPCLKIEGNTLTAEPVRREPVPAVRPGTDLGQGMQDSMSH